MRKFLLGVTLAAAVTAVFPAVECFGVLATNLDSTFVFPSPFQPPRGHTVMTFDNLTASARLRVYKITGEVVYDADITTIDGTFTWAGVNDSGDKLATGVYIYLITNDNGQKKTGKLSIIR